MFNRMLRSFLISLIPALALTGCHDRYLSIYETMLFPKTGYRSQDDTVMTDSLSGQLFSRLQRAGTYGIKLDYDLPQQHRGKPLVVVVQGVTRTSNAYSNALIMVSASTAKKGQVASERVTMRYQYTAMNQWCLFRDSVLLRPEYFGSIPEHLTIYTHLPQGNELFDVKDLTVTISEKQAW